MVGGSATQGFVGSLVLENGGSSGHVVVGEDDRGLVGGTRRFGPVATPDVAIHGVLELRLGLEPHDLDAGHQPAPAGAIPKCRETERW